MNDGTNNVLMGSYENFMFQLCIKVGMYGVFDEMGAFFIWVFCWINEVRMKVFKIPNFKTPWFLR